MKTTTTLLLCLVMSACGSAEDAPLDCGDLDATTPTATPAGGMECAQPGEDELAAIFLDTGLPCAVRDLDGSTFETECELDGVIFEWRGTILCAEEGWTAIASRRTLTGDVLCSAEYRLTVPR